MKVLELRIKELSKIIEFCLEEKYFIHVLTLIYSSIDTFAYLVRGKMQSQVSRKDFLDWCDKYLIPNCVDIYCDSIDIYAARCSILHTYGYKSNLVQKGEAKKIFYSYGNKTALQLKQLTDLTTQKGKTSFLHINQLSKGFIKGINFFMNDIEQNEYLKELVSTRSKEYYISLEF